MYCKEKLIRRELEVSFKELRAQKYNLWRKHEQWVNEERHYMKRKEANALEEQLLKQKMDELHKKLHQVVEMSQENLPSSQGTSEVCGLPIASHTHCSDFCCCLSLPCSIFRVNSDVSLVTSFLNYSPLPPPRTRGKDHPTHFQQGWKSRLKSQESE